MNAILSRLAQARADEIVEKADYPRISRSETVSKLISLFQDSGSYEALVTGGDGQSLVSVRDALRVVHPERTSVASISGGSHLKIAPGARVYDAATVLVNNRIRLLPMVDGSSLLGLVSQRRILSEMRKCEDLKELAARELMTKDPTMVEHNAPIGLARSLMLRGGFSHLPVVGSGGSFLGLITARDLVWNYVKPKESMKVGERTGERQSWPKMTISGLVDRHPLRATPRTKISEIVDDMVERNRSCCIVVEHSARAVGIITPRDIVSLLKQYKPRFQVPLYMVGAESVDGDLVNSAKRKVERVAVRGLKMHPDIREIIVHAKIAPSGARRRIAIRARIYTNTGVLVVQTSGRSSFLSVVDDLCEKLDRRLRAAKGYRRKNSSRTSKHANLNLQ